MDHYQEVDVALSESDNMNYIRRTSPVGYISMTSFPVLKNLITSETVRDSHILLLNTRPYYEVEIAFQNATM